MTKANADNWKEKHGNTKLEKDYSTKIILKDESLTKHNMPHLFLFKKDFDDNTFITKNFEFINA